MPKIFIPFLTFAFSVQFLILWLPVITIHHYMYMPVQIVAQVIEDSTLLWTPIAPPTSLSYFLFRLIIYTNDLFTENVHFYYSVSMTTYRLFIELLFFLSIWKLYIQSGKIHTYNVAVNLWNSSGGRSPINEVSCWRFFLCINKFLS